MSNVTNTLLLSADNFKQLTVVSKNIDEQQQVGPIIFDAQKRYLQPILCDDFYDELITQIENNTVTDTNLTLLNKFVRPTLAKYALYLYILHGWVKIRQAGAVNETGDNYQVVTRDDIKYLRRETLETAQTYALQLQQELDKYRSTKYETYNDCDCDERGGINQVNFFIV